MKTILEYQKMNQLVGKIPRSSHQMNKLFESDCELVKVDSKIMALSTDAIGEEIDIGLYQDPELWGWMTIMSSVSDLSASCASPLGLLINNQWKYGTPLDVQKRFFQGTQKALKASGVSLLGGDSGSGESHCHSSTILGQTNKAIQRTGLKPGDLLTLISRQQTGPGPALAFRFLFHPHTDLFLEKDFRPRPPLTAAIKLRPWVRSSIDTSDGLGSSLQILKELNPRVHLNLVWNEKIISRKARQFCHSTHIHPLMLWMSDHGDYQSLFVIPEKNIFKALKICPDLHIIGQATKIKTTSKKTPTSIIYENKKIHLPLEALTQCPRDVNAIREFVEQMNSYFKKNG